MGQAKQRKRKDGRYKKFKGDSYKQEQQITMSARVVRDPLENPTNRERFIDAIKKIREEKNESNKRQVSGDPQK